MHSLVPMSLGTEVRYSAYEAFALHVGFMLLTFGHPQRLAVSIARLARPKLEAQYTTIVRSHRPHFLVIVGRREGQKIVRSVNVVPEDKLEGLLAREKGAFIVQMELSESAQRLMELLEDTTPSKRGRGSS